MKRIPSHAVGLQQGTLMLFSDFEDDGPMWTGTGPRVVRRHIAFDEAFRAPPCVLTSIAMLDMDGGTNHRADLSHEGVTTEGFEAVFRTWGDTRVARARIDWMAIGAASDDDAWDV